jgi:hypothetical protein
MIAFGNEFSEGKLDMNKLYGYRTKMSMKNNDTWRFAHIHLGKIWIRAGRIMLRITLITMPILLLLSITISVLFEDSEIVPTAITIILGAYILIQMIVMAFTTAPVEEALKKNFDKNGFRIE